jgi:sensor histidine kinase YesM
VLENIKDLEEKAYASFLPPHFVFNALTVIQSLMNTGQLNDANIYLAKFGTLIRANQEFYRKKEISLLEELELLKLYIQFEQKRFGNSFLFEIEVSPDIDKEETLIPINLIRPFLENSIWLGLLPDKGDGIIQVKIKRKGESLMIVEIIDNGRGFYEQLNKPKNIETVEKLIDQIRKDKNLPVSFSCHSHSPDKKSRRNIVTLILPFV